MDYEREILVQVLSLLDFWGMSLTTFDAGDRSQSWCRDKTSKFPAEYEKLGVRYIPAMWAEWGGYELTTAGRQAFSRAARHLESLGLVVTVRQSGDRLTHLRPTPEGLRVAVRLDRTAGTRRTSGTSPRQWTKPNGPGKRTWKSWGPCVTSKSPRRKDAGRSEGERDRRCKAPS